MITHMKLDEARELLNTAQERGYIFSKVANGLTYWIQKYADARAAWYYGVLHYLESWVEESGYFLESVGPIGGIDYSSPELATAIGEFVEEMLD